MSQLLRVLDPGGPIISCPLCGQRRVVVMMCVVCWANHNGEGDGIVVSTEERAKLALFEATAPMDDAYRATYEQLKKRLQT